jgi:hypothetical protein
MFIRNNKLLDPWSLHLFESFSKKWFETYIYLFMYSCHNNDSFRSNIKPWYRSQIQYKCIWQRNNTRIHEQINICKTMISFSDTIQMYMTTDRWFSPGTPVSSNKTDRHDRSEILLKVSLKSINQIILICRILYLPGYIYFTGIN